MDKIRSFVAVAVPADTRQVLTAVAQELNRLLPDNAPSSPVRWVKCEQMHLTLRFLGDTPLAKLPEITAAMDWITSGKPSLSIQLDKLGCFPNPRRPRVIWAGISGQVEELGALQRELEAALVPLGWPPEGKPFQPHLTLGRVKDGRAVVESRFPWGKGLMPATIPVDALHLIESQLRPDGPIYKVRHTSRLLG
jgi:RNA 2',3'-cyclic 3'-phosphodiesterase